jgi:quercetin dioxygenase-like cupin family protein
MSSSSFLDSKILRPSDLPSKNRGGGASTVPLVTYSRGATSFLNGITTFEPGAKIGHHTHNVVESVVVLAGTAIVDIDGNRSTLDPFDVTFVPANIPHHFENPSATEEMRIFWTYASVHASRMLVSAGQHERVDREAPRESENSAKAEDEVVEAVAIHLKSGKEAEARAVLGKLASKLQQCGNARTFDVSRQVHDPLSWTVVIRWSNSNMLFEDFVLSVVPEEDRKAFDRCLSAPVRAAEHSHVFTGF